MHATALACTLMALVPAWGYGAHFWSLGLSWGLGGGALIFLMAYLIGRRPEPDDPPGTPLLALGVGAALCGLGYLAHWTVRALS